MQDVAIYDNGCVIRHLRITAFETVMPSQAVSSLAALGGTPSALRLIVRLTTSKSKFYTLWILAVKTSSEVPAWASPCFLHLVFRST